MVSWFLTRVPRTLNAERTIFSTNSPGKPSYPCTRVKLDPYLVPYTKIKSKGIKDLNIRAQTIKTFRWKQGKIFIRIGVGNDYTDMTPKAEETTKKIHKLDIIEVKTFVNQRCYQESKRQPTEWEKMFANHISDKRLTSRLCKVQLNN